MRWAWKVGRLFGIEIKIHATFLLILLWVGLAHWLTERDPFAALSGITFIMAVFACVVLHELGHALTAKKFGIKTRDITLLPIGGLARLERMPDDPKQEVWVALAGPAVNVVIALVLFASLRITSSWESIGGLALTGGSIFERLMWVNVFLLVFNLLPAFPMDGGRILRGLLATRMNYVRATQIAANLGQGMAFLFALGGLIIFHNPVLVFIGIFVWIGAAQESSMAAMKSALGGVRVETAMLTDYVTLSPRDPLTRVAQLILAGSQQDFPVVENGTLVGVLTRGNLLSALSRGRDTTLVGEVMNRDFKVVEASEMLEAIVPRLQTDCKIIPVTRFGELVGLITPENVGEFVMIKAALGGERRAA
jgi:Zn-dependent protease/predicted transcriptional regulator